MMLLMHMCLLYVLAYEYMHSEMDIFQVSAEAS